MSGRKCPDCNSNLIVRSSRLVMDAICVDRCGYVSPNLKIGTDFYNYLLDKCLASDTTKIDNLKNELNEFRKENEHLRKGNSKLYKERIETINANCGLETELKNLKKDITHFHKLNRGYEERIRKFDEVNCNLNVECMKSYCTINEVKDENGCFIVEIDQLKKENLELQESYKKSEIECGRLYKLNRGLKNSGEKLAKSNGNLIKDCNKVRDENHIFEMELERLKNVEQLLKESRKINNVVVAERNQLKLEKQDLCDRNSKLVDEKNSLNVDKQIFRAEMLEFRDKSIKLVAEKNSLKEGKQVLREAINGFRDSNKKFANENLDLTMEIVSIRDTNNELEKKNLNYRKRLYRIKGVIDNDE